MAKIFMQTEPEWMMRKENFAKHLENIFMETIRRGLSQHLANIAPCQFVDFDKLMSLCQISLGKFNIHILRLNLEHFANRLI